MDKNLFFKNVTLKICGSLKIEKALQDCALYIKDFIPLSSLTLSTYDLREKRTRVLAIATEENGRLSSLNVQRSMDIHNRITSWYHGENRRSLRAIESIHTDSVMKDIVEKMNIPDSSALQLFLVLGSVMMGSLIVVRGEMTPYTQNHMALLSLLNEPFAISLSNYIQYREVIKHKRRLEDDNQYFQSELKRKAGEEIVGADFGLKTVFEQVRQVAPLNSPVLLLGETGTGKEVIAHTIHNLSKRREGPFIQVNCGAIPGTLMDSELFGHEKGAFTGATTQRRGRFERAHRGTIFLDEIGELPSDVQIRLLRVLQERYIERVGGENPVKIDIRIIAATHRDLPGMIEDGRFREDLYYRLQVFPILIPPLRERRFDIPSLVHYFIEKKSREMGIRQRPSLAPNVLNRLMDYDWPGNVRELENAVERALITCRGGTLEFPEFSGENAPRPNRIQAPLNGLPSGSDTGFADLETAVCKHIHHALFISNGKIHGPGGAAELLNINPSTLRNRMIKLGIPFGRTAAGPPGI